MTAIIVCDSENSELMFIAVAVLVRRVRRMMMVMVLLLLVALVGSGYRISWHQVLV